MKWSKLVYMERSFISLYSEDLIIWTSVEDMLIIIDVWFILLVWLIFYLSGMWCVGCYSIVESSNNRGRPHRVNRGGPGGGSISSRGGPGRNSARSSQRRNSDRAIPEQDIEFWTQVNSLTYLCHINNWDKDENNR